MMNTNLGRTHTKISAIGLLLLTNGLVQAQDQSADYTEPYQQHALQIFRTSIAYRTTASHGEVPALANYLADQFRAGGFADEDIHVLPLTLPDGAETAALVVRYRGDGSSGRKPILLLAHMDVVEAIAQDWQSDPFTLIEEDGYFFGRGTYDDKFGTTTLTATFLRLKAEGFQPTRDLIIAFDGDEETQFTTARTLVTTYRDLTDAEFALNADTGGGVLDEYGNPIFYRIQTTEKTYATFELTTRDPGGHSARPGDDNAIYELAHALQKIEAFRFPVRSNEVTLRYFELTANVRSGELSEAMRHFAANPNDEKAADILHRYPFENSFARTTCVATMIRGGHAENALPRSATATVNCRIFPGVAVTEVQATLERIVENDQLQVQVLGDPEESLTSPLREDVIAAVTKAVHARFPNLPIVPFMTAGGTVGQPVRAAGIPTYGIMGLFMRDEDDFSHGLNERVPVRSFYGALEFWHLLLIELAGQ